MLSDGQKILAGGDHLWTVSSFKDRNNNRKDKHRRSVGRYNQLTRIGATLRNIGEQHPMSETMTSKELASLLKPIVGKYMGTARPEAWVAASLQMMDFSGVDEERDIAVNSPSTSSLSSMLKGLKPVSLWDEGTRIMPDRSSRRTVRAYNVRGALNAIALRLLQRYNGETPNTDYDEQVVSTKEMLASGLETTIGQAQWSIHAPQPVQNPETHLSIDPYLLGAWLADGSKRAGELTSDTKAGDLDYVAERFLEKGYDVTYKSDGKSFYVRGFTGKLRYAGLLSNKHIPEKYFFSSIGQRLELVRGLLDQDGSIDENGSIEFTQSADHEPIMRGMVRLLRSLGIVVHEPTRSKASYTLDGEHHDTQDRLRLTFTTNLPVFALERKRMLLPKTLRETQQWMYIKDIRKVEDVPCRCITVGSPDHTYLVNDYVPTHNTMAAFSLFLQWSKIDARDGKGKTPCIYINPKAGNDLEDATRSQGGTVIRLDSDVANGTFDPFNVIPNVEEAKEIAVLMMTNILGGDTKMESAMTAMLDYGVKHGARCVGRALLVAAQAVAKTIKAGNTAESIGLPSNTLEVFSTINMNLKANQGLRLIFGTDNDTKPLTISQNLTLINAGDRSLIPEGQDDSMTARIRQWTLRMVVMGAGTAVRGRDGMVGVDEAWVFMGKDKGASQTFEQWVRMARAQRFTPVIISQKVQEFIDANLTGGISRALLLALDNPEEANGTVSPAKSAERLLGIEDPNGRILQRMGADDTLDNGQPNPNSLKRLVSASTGKTVRGAVAYFKDGSKQPIPVEIVIPPALLKEISTTATDKIAREQRKNKEQ